MRVTSFSDARRNFKAVIDTAIQDVDVTLIHRRNGGNAVVMSEDHYSSLMETLYLLSNPVNAKALERAIAQDKKNAGIKRELLDLDTEK